METHEHWLQHGKDAAGDSYAKLKEELNEVKQVMDCIVAEVWKLKVQHVEPKPELDTRKLHVMLDSSVLAHVFVGFVGVLIGVIVVVMWKRIDIGTCFIDS